MFGLLDVHDPERLSSELAELRRGLFADPYFNGVHSVQANERKTALYFHAKADLPEVRREVLKVLALHTLHFSAVVKNKRSVLGYVQSSNDSDPAHATGMTSFTTTCAGGWSNSGYTPMTPTASRSPHAATKTAPRRCGTRHHPANSSHL